MRVLDYLRLGSCSIAAHKKRVAMVVVIVGVLFGVLMAVCALLAGTELVVSEKETEITHGRVLLQVVVDQQMCEQRGNCDIAESLVRAREVVERYGGEVLEGYFYPQGAFYEVPQGVLDIEEEGWPDDKNIPVVVVPSYVMRSWLQVTWESHWVAEKQIATLNTLRERTVGKIVRPLSYDGEESDEEYYIADWLPSGSSLSLGQVGHDMNALNLILGAISTGSGQRFVLRPSEEMEADRQLVSDQGMLMVLLPDIETAYKFSQDPANHCRAAQTVASGFGEVGCPDEYEFMVSAMILNPLENVEVFRALWQVLRIFIVIFAVVAAVVALTTYARLVKNDLKTMALYQALGASRRQVAVIYLVYLLMISMLAVVAAVVIAGLMLLTVNLTGATMLTQVFTLGFGMDAGRIWLVGLSPEIFIMMLVMLLTAPIGILLNLSVFGSHSVSKTLK